MISSFDFIVRHIFLQALVMKSPPSVIRGDQISAAISKGYSASLCLLHPLAWAEPAQSSLLGLLQRGCRTITFGPFVICSQRS